MSLPNGRAKYELHTKLPSMNDVRDSGSQPERSQSEPPASFDEWLDGRLKVLYEAVVNEPLPPEILDLLQKPRRPK
jgi:hypothetical protein